MRLGSVTAVPQSFGNVNECSRRHQHSGSDHGFAMVPVRVAFMFGGNVIYASKIRDALIVRRGGNSSPSDTASHPGGPESSITPFGKISELANLEVVYVGFEEHLHLRR